MTTKKILLVAGAAALLAIAELACAQAVIRGEESAGSYANIKSTSGVLQVAPPSTAADPCQNPAVAKSSAVINVTSATTTQLVPLSGATVIYACEFGITISQVITTPNTLKFVYGTGASCGTGTTNLTGLFGDGGVTAAAPIFVTSGAAGTSFKTAAGNALCVTTAIGGSGSFQGWVTFVQQ
jgi:hypothetical protein